MEIKSHNKDEDQNLEESSMLPKKIEYNELGRKIKEVEELKEKYLRLQAEFENYKKFMERQRVNYLRYSNEKLLQEVIKIYDDFNRALKGLNGAQFIQGLKLILNNFKTLLKNESISLIEAEGKQFNPEIHECMMVGEDPTLPEGLVTEILEDGYYLNGKVLRPSKVKVNK